MPINIMAANQVFSQAQSGHRNGPRVWSDWVFSQDLK